MTLRPEGASGFDVGVSLEYQREAGREPLLHYLLHRQSKIVRERDQFDTP